MFGEFKILERLDRKRKYSPYYANNNVYGLPLKK